MSYRKITVDGKVYEYTIGKTHTKIKGIGVWKNEDVGHNVTLNNYCECCGESYETLYPGKSGNTFERMRVRPHDIMKKIRIPTADDTFKALAGK